jgi:pimeloyl-ACP methyl ester carboxylesterase
MGKGPAALFVHGHLLSAHHWRHQLAALGDARRCIAVDLLGLGYSEPLADADVGYPAQASMLTAVADALGLERFDLSGTTAADRSPSCSRRPTRRASARSR